MKLTFSHVQRIIALCSKKLKMAVFTVCGIFFILLRCSFTGFLIQGFLVFQVKLRVFENVDLFLPGFWSKRILLVVREKLLVLVNFRSLIISLVNFLILHILEKTLINLVNYLMVYLKRKIGVRLFIEVISVSMILVFPFFFVTPHDYHLHFLLDIVSVGVLAVSKLNNF